jgi:hypothetical protein
MRARARKQCALLLALLCLAALLQGASCRVGNGGAGFGHGGGRGDGMVVQSKRSSHHHHYRYYHHHNHSSAAAPRGCGLDWRVSGAAAATLAAAAAFIW